MAEQTTTTKQAAVWKPPRLTLLLVGSTVLSGTRTWPGTDHVYEGSQSDRQAEYRMPRSGEPVRYDLEGNPL